MLDLIVGIVILAFILLGLRGGLIKTLGGIVAVFAALFLATGTIQFLSKDAPRLGDLNNFGAMILFLLVLIVSYLLLELALSLLFGKVITIVILGSLDRIGGVLLGGFKGILICGVIFQLAFYLPISDASKKQIRESKLAAFSISVYEWAYPYARKVMPRLKSFLGEKLEKGVQELEKTEPGKMAEEAQKTKEAQEERILKLLKEQKLLHDAPARKTEELK